MGAKLEFMELKETCGDAPSKLTENRSPPGSSGHTICSSRGRSREINYNTSSSRCKH